jgi:hypothetical protein
LELIVQSLVKVLVRALARMERRRQMPLLRYFLYVGGALLALLFISNAYLPKLPVEASADYDLPVVRIHSDRKWPERVVFDTSQPTIVPQQTASAVANVPAPARIADVSAKANPRDSFAQLQPSDQTQAQPADLKKPEKKVVRKRRIAKRRAAPPVMLVAQQPQFSLFGTSTW